jgi:exosome complex component RRP4
MKQKTEQSASLVVEDRQVVVPGEVLANGMGYLPGEGAYRSGDKLCAEQLGITSINGKVVKIIPLSGKYMPKVGDKVIGRVDDILLMGWHVDVASPYKAVLPLKDATREFTARGADLRKFFDIGEYIFTKITSVSSMNLTDLSMRGPGLRKLPSGRILKVSALKVPRVIGKEGSMVSLIKKETECHIYVGQNGVIWLSGEPAKEAIAVAAIRYIEKNAHRKGLTDEVQKLLTRKA